MRLGLPIKEFGDSIIGGLKFVIDEVEDGSQESNHAKNQRSEGQRTDMIT